ncbi:MAG: 4a-hydroxytetrahydrobiopterin dehydratase [Kangiellaceae bacterium]|nr:4a-hydroxytetrahydrobiopterin dehydratase [Kangiellaceae bacterium]MCW8999329.1 4a-hydroxytetrahydrobiopterin dehydratase [Kangiellaceae bacterium]MCW9016576.1 4a-hydroxytetrahydrobiopterin dehydratase [Kangiellaceae bacterium]
MSKSTKTPAPPKTAIDEGRSVFELNGQALLQLIAELPEWRIKQSADKLRLERTYYFNSEEDAVDFSDRILELSKKQLHQPVILISKSSVTVKWLSEKPKGFQRSEFTCAAKTDSLLQPAKKPN